MIIGGPAGGGEMTVKLADFGIARASEQTRITQVGSVVGTAAYLAPEQARGEEANPVVRRLLARRRALPVPDRAAAVRGRLARRARRAPAVRAAPAPQLLQRRRPAGRWATRSCVALECDPSRRYATAGELADALRRGLMGESPAGTAQTRVLGGDAPTAATRHMPRTRTQRRPQRRPAPPRQRQPAPPPKRRRAPTVARNLLALIAILLLAAVIAAIVVLASGSNSGQDQPGSGRQAQRQRPDRRPQAGRRRQHQVGLRPAGLAAGAARGASAGRTSGTSSTSARGCAAVAAGRLCLTTPFTMFESRSLQGRAPDDRSIGA